MNGDLFMVLPSAESKSSIHRRRLLALRAELPWQALNLNRVEFSGVVAEEPLLDGVAQVGPLPDLLDGTFARLPVRHVGRDHDPILSDKLDDLWHEFLLGLASEVDLAVAHVLARSPLGERSTVGGLGVKVVIHPFDQVGNPIDASFQKGDFEPRKTIKIPPPKNA